MTDFKDLNNRTDEFRFANGRRTCVLQFRELRSVNRVKVYGVDHEGNPFRVNLGAWDSLELATEDDFRRLAQESEQALNELEGPTDEEITNTFNEWWHRKGSALAPDASEETRLATEIGWRNGAYISDLPLPF